MSECNPFPSCPDEQKKLKDAIRESSNALTRINGERDYINETKKMIKKDLKIPVKKFNQLVKTYHKQNFGVVTAENEEFELMYSKLFGEKDPE